jgi:hypothetical protein
VVFSSVGFSFHLIFSTKVNCLLTNILKSLNLTRTTLNLKPLKWQTLFCSIFSLLINESNTCPHPEKSSDTSYHLPPMNPAKTLPYVEGYPTPDPHPEKASDTIIVCLQ